MTTLDLIDLTCPVCALSFRSQTVVSTEARGGKRTDFHECAIGMQPLPYLVHLCSQCGYAGLPVDFGIDVDISDPLRERVWEELAPVVNRETASGSTKYEHAAKVAEWQGSEPRYLADLYLRAAWCCVDEGDTEAERYFRRKAAWLFIDALADVECLPVDERAVITYLVAELWRRIGDDIQAADWFDDVVKEITDPTGQSWILQAAHQQKTEPREWFLQ